MKTLTCFLILLCSSYLSIAQQSDSSYSKLLDSSLTNTGKISFKIKGDFILSKQHAVNETIKLEFKSKTDVVFVKVWNNINDSMADVIISNKKFLIENLFKTQPSPYPDVISSQVDCPDRLKPLPYDSTYQNIRVSAFRLFANNRFIYGECTDDVIIYTSAYIIAYNPREKKLTEIRYFTPKLTPVNIPEDIMRCVKPCIN